MQTAVQKFGGLLPTPEIPRRGLLPMWQAKQGSQGILRAPHVPYQLPDLSNGQSLPLRPKNGTGGKEPNHVRLLRKHLHQWVSFKLPYGGSFEVDYFRGSGVNTNINQGHGIA